MNARSRRSGLSVSYHDEGPLAAVRARSLSSVEQCNFVSLEGLCRAPPCAACGSNAKSAPAGGCAFGQVWVVRLLLAVCSSHNRSLSSMEQSMLVSLVHLWRAPPCARPAGPRQQVDARSRGSGLSVSC